MYYVTYFYPGLGGECTPIERLFCDKELFVSAPTSSGGQHDGTFWGTLRNSAHLYKRGVSDSDFLKHNDWQSLPLSSEDIPWISTFMLYAQYDFFWVVHPPCKITVAETSSLEGGYLSRPKSIEEINSLFGQLADQFEWCIFPCGGHGQSFIVFLTKSSSHLEDLQKSPFFVEEKNKIIASEFTYCVKDRVVEHCRGILLEDVNPRNGLIGFLAKNNYKHGSSYVLLPFKIQDCLSRISLSEIDEQNPFELIASSSNTDSDESIFLYELRNEKLFAKLGQSALERRFKMVAVSGSPELETLKRTAVDPCEYSFLSEIGRFETFEWILLFGFSHGDSKFQIFVSGNRMLFNDIARKIDEGTIASDIIACF